MDKMEKNKLPDKDQKKLDEAIKSMKFSRMVKEWLISNMEEIEIDETKKWTNSKWKVDIDAKVDKAKLRFISDTMLYSFSGKAKLTTLTLDHFLDITLTTKLRKNNQFEEGLKILQTI